MPRRPEIGNVQLYPNRPLRSSDRNGYVLKFYCPLQQTRIRKNCGTRDRREARRIQRECRERLLNGEYTASGGVILAGQQQSARRTAKVVDPGRGMSWEAARERYRQHRAARGREASLVHSLSRIDLAGRIFENELQPHLDGELMLPDCMTLDRFEYLQEQLLAGAESRFDRRSPNTVNSTIGAVIAFARFCKKHDWIPAVPDVQKLEVEEVMKGRPVTGEEFDRMLAVTPDVVGPNSAPSWQFAMRVLWETGFRIGDLMDFHWNDEQHIHPRWKGQPTLVIPSSQKNRKLQELPLLPGLAKLLETVPAKNRTGWVVDPQPMEFTIQGDTEWFRPDDRTLAELVQRFTNRAISRACGVSDMTVRNWLKAAAIERSNPPTSRGEVPADEVRSLRTASERRKTFTSPCKGERMTTERVSRVISLIGQKANIIVRDGGNRASGNSKYASAHDLRRGFAHRMINLGVTAETLTLLLRHADFATTRKFYGATRSAQAAGQEVRELLERTNPSFVGGLVGGPEPTPAFNPEEVAKLKAILATL